MPKHVLIDVWRHTDGTFEIWLAGEHIPLNAEEMANLTELLLEAQESPEAIGIHILVKYE